MEQLFAKLSNFSYELFGVILPGLIGLIFLTMLWVALGPLAPMLSSNFLPHLTSSNAAPLVESISLRTGVGIAAPVLLITYFLGHTLHWISRSGERDDKLTRNSWRRTWHSLFLRIPKPASSYEASLQPLYDIVQAKFAPPGTTLTWPQFYPVVRSYLTGAITHSLVANYQNKYTLHRSITAAAAAIFWLTFLAIGMGLLTHFYCGISPRWWLLGGMELFSLIIVWGFSDSYAYNWKLFGNSLITESYAALVGPKK